VRPKHFVEEKQSAAPARNRNTRFFGSLGCSLFVVPTELGTVAHSSTVQNTVLQLNLFHRKHKSQCVLEFFTAVIDTSLQPLLFHLSHCINIYSHWLGEQFSNLSLNTLYILPVQ